MSPSLGVESFHGDALGTSWSVKVSPGCPRGKDCLSAVANALAQVDKEMSTWRDDSELSAIRRGPGRVRVSAETAGVVSAALQVAKQTNGAFDPTVEPLMELWGLHGKRLLAEPSSEEVEAARRRVDYKRVKVGSDKGRAWVDAGGTALDLSAIAKGHAVDRVAMALSSLGVSDYLVEVGGEVRARGSGPSGYWRLGVDWPSEGLAPGEKLGAVVALKDLAMATSGNYRNTYQVDGHRVVHTMDPRSGRPVFGQVASATVVAPDCQTADAWATALMVLGPSRGMELIEGRPDLEALVFVPDGDGFRAGMSGGMGELLAE